MTRFTIDLQPAPIRGKEEMPKRKRTTPAVVMTLVPGWSESRETIAIGIPLAKREASLIGSDKQRRQGLAAEPVRNLKPATPTIPFLQCWAEGIPH
jgi:hypothetical protein